MHLASIQKIDQILPHSDPEVTHIELAVIEGWQAVVKKGEFKSGDCVIFIQIDTILPNKPWSSFLAKDKDNTAEQIRLKTVRLRGEYSQGLVLPLTIDPFIGLLAALPCSDNFIDQDVAHILGVRKYSKPEPSEGSKQKGDFPTDLVTKTDEINGLSSKRITNEVMSSHYLSTLKLDGTSITILAQAKVVNDVCSRNNKLVENPQCKYWIGANKLELPDSDDEIIIQGELMGPGIQGNQLELDEYKVYVYNVKVNGKWLSRSHIKDYCTHVLNCETVPDLHIDHFKDLQSLQKAVNDICLPNGKPAEGAVFRPIDYAERLTATYSRPFGFKLINQNYKD